jgi:hypothetical protein
MLALFILERIHLWQPRIVCVPHSWLRVNVSCQFLECMYGMRISDIPMIDAYYFLPPIDLYRYCITRQSTFPSLATCNGVSPCAFL